MVGACLMLLLAVVGVMPLSAPAVTLTFRGIDVPGLLALGWVGAVGTTLGYAFGVMAVPRVGARLASFIGLSEVLFALGFAWLLLGEAPSAVQIVGGAVLLAGVVLVRMDAGAAPLAALPADAMLPPAPEPLPGAVSESRPPVPTPGAVGSDIR